MKPKSALKTNIVIVFPRNKWKNKIKPVNAEFIVCYYEYYLNQRYKKYFSKKIIPIINNIKCFRIIDKQTKKVVKYIYEF